ncbi:MAG: hydantoinase/oxoprolinase N-terminal domain-containing protein, partial [Pseudomonadota bacterium]|nr:hydantoinase/oxoprolinase N-terminal domain-containing protein [Pseudomonadota bacterium]
MAAHAIAADAPVRIAVDIGGTFTDVQILDEATGLARAHKTATTPADPSIGLLTGISEAAERFGFGFDQVSMLIHGTTIATNAVLEQKLPAGALVTTAGFEDVLEIGRHMRRDIYGSLAEERLQMGETKSKCVREDEAALGLKTEIPGIVDEEPPEVMLPERGRG